MRLKGAYQWRIDIAKGLYLSLPGWPALIAIVVVNVVRTTIRTAACEISSRGASLNCQGSVQVIKGGNAPWVQQGEGPWPGRRACCRVGEDPMQKLDQAGCRQGMTNPGCQARFAIFGLPPPEFECHSGPSGCQLCGGPGRDHTSASTFSSSATLTTRPWSSKPAI
jgi:hypothetical protein